MDRLRTVLQSTTPRGRVVLGLSAAGALAVALLLFQLAAKPSYAQLLSGLDPADTGQVTAALDEKGIGHEVRNNGTAVAVRKEQLAQARIALAEKDLAGGGKRKPGFELFDEQKLGTSDFQQKVAYERALEGEMARTVEQVDGVRGAEVELVLPEEELFASEQAPAKAAVLLAGDGAGLEAGSVKGIARLVASGVKGLDAKNVTITDGTGRLLWPNGQEGDDPTAAAGGKQAAEARYERGLESSIGAMLAQSVGPGRALVRVKADLNTDQATRDRLTYGKEAVPLRSETERERLRGAAPRGGASGAGGNIPSYAAGGAGGNANYRRETEKTDYAVDKTVERTKVAPGRVNRMQVALMVDDSVPASQIAGLRDAVEAAAGVDEERGDRLTVTSVPFAAEAEVEKAAESPLEGVLPFAKWAALGLAGAAFVFFVGRHLRRREDEELTDPAWLREITAPRPLAALAGPEEPAALAAGPEPSAAMRQLQQAADQHPDRLAQQVRLWMQEAS